MAWDWQVFCKETTTGEQVAGCFGKGGDQTYLNWIFSAWGWTMTVALSALVVALVAGLVIGTLRTLPNNPWLVRFANAWVELFRNVPLLVQIFLWYFVVPSIFPAMKDLPSVVLVVLALGLFTSARAPPCRRIATCCCRWRCAS
jgi:glutamate/aspartate transport system permease protein